MLLDRAAPHRRYPAAKLLRQRLGEGGGRRWAGDPSYSTAEVPLATPLPIALRALGPEALRHCLTAVLPNSTCCYWPVLHTIRRDAIVIRLLGSVNCDRRVDACARSSARTSGSMFQTRCSKQARAALRIGRRRATLTLTKRGARLADPEVRQLHTFQHGVPASVSMQRGEGRVDRYTVRAVSPAECMPFETLEGIYEVSTGNVQHGFFVLGDRTIVEAQAGLVHYRRRFRLPTEQPQGACLIHVCVGIVRGNDRELSRGSETLLGPARLRIGIGEEQPCIHVVRRHLDCMGEKRFGAIVVAPVEIQSSFVAANCGIEWIERLDHIVFAQRLLEPRAVHQEGGKG